jgi:hypothetical protein
MYDTLPHAPPSPLHTGAGHAARGRDCPDPGHRDRGRCHDKDHRSQQPHPHQEDTDIHNIPGSSDHGVDQGNAHTLQCDSSCSRQTQHKTAAQAKHFSGFIIVHTHTHAHTRTHTHKHTHKHTQTLIWLQYYYHTQTHTHTHTHTHTCKHFHAHTVSQENVSHSISLEDQLANRQPHIADGPHAHSTILKQPFSLSLTHTHTLSLTHLAHRCLKVNVQ